MNREEKQAVVESLKEKFENSLHFYVTDASTLTVADINEFRGKCFENGIDYLVAKNTLIIKALDQMDRDYTEMYDIFKGPTSLMFTETANLPAKVLKDFRKTHEKPVLKAAFIDSDLIVGDENIESLASLKSKEELIGEIISLLQSPAKNVISALQSSGEKLAGIIKTLGERPE